MLTIKNVSKNTHFSRLFRGIPTSRLGFLEFEKEELDGERKYVIAAQQVSIVEE